MTEQQTHHDETIPPDLQATADLLQEALAAEPMPAAQTPATAMKSKRPIRFARFVLPATAAAAILLFLYEEALCLFYVIFKNVNIFLCGGCI